MKKNRKTGFTLIEIMIVIAIIGILASVATTYYARAKEHSQSKVCKETMFNIEGAITQHCLNTGTEEYPVILDETFLKTLVSGQYLKSVPKCPASGIYTLETISNNKVKERTVHCSLHKTRMDQ